MEHEKRTYRRWLDSDLVSFEVRVEQSDLQISAESAPGGLRRLAAQALRAVRGDLEGYLAEDPEFERALTPRPVPAEAPAIVREMAEAARRAGVGPMAAVAGAVAEHVGRALLAETRQVIVENGGDIFLYTTRPRVAALFAGSSPLTGRLGLRITDLDRGLGLCTSSGTVGPSLSFGKADAAIVLAESAALADAAASALGNRIQRAEDIEAALGFVQTIPGLLGAAAVVGEALGAWGKMEFVRVTAETGTAD
jgi:ApbE superfamily uncharacterized protein (UPF0280 family)